jgi:hypothetical protein
MSNGTTFISARNDSRLVGRSAPGLGGGGFRSGARRKDLQWQYKFNPVSCLYSDMTKHYVKCVFNFKTVGLRIVSCVEFLHRSKFCTSRKAINYWEDKQVGVQIM